jgi:hypothetical protein
LNQKLLAEADASFQAIADDSEALDNQTAFPLWTSFADQHQFPAQFRVQDFVGTELVLFKIIQPHAKQDDRRPNDTPALWTKIEFSGGVEVWSQPIGGDGKYPYLDPSTGLPYRVTHNGRLWENNFQGGLNVWQPGEFGWTDLGTYP